MGRHNLNVDRLRVMLTNAEPSALAETIRDIIELSPGNGYEAGGAVAPFISGEQAGGVYRLVLGPSPEWRAASGLMGPFRYPVLYNGTNGRLIGWWDYGESITLRPREPFVPEFNEQEGVLVLS